MSKGNRKREAHADKKQKRLELEKFEANKRRVRKITTIVTVVLLAALFATLIGGCVAQNVRLNRGEYLRSEIAGSSKNIDVDGAMMNYWLNDTYNSFLSYYGSYVAYFGLDTSMSLKLQEVSEGESWFAYLMSGAMETASSVLALCEAAAADGVSLTDAEIAAVRSRADGMDTGLYGRGTNNNDIYNVKLLEALAYKYQFIKEAELTPDDAAVAARYDESTKTYQYVDYASFPLYYVVSGSDVKAGRDQAVIITEDDVKAFADKLAATTTLDDFKASAREVLLAETPDITDGNIDSTLASVATTGALYVEDNEALEWAFTATEGDTKVIIDEENQTYTVYLLTKEAYRDEARTINVRHILLYDDTYENREGALAKAEELLAEFKAGGATVDDFALLALEYSEDPGSYYNGGLYMNVAEGNMVESFDAWCFEDGRKAGDTGIVESEYGVHVMYFDGEGGEAWTASVKNDIITEELEKLSTEWAEAYPVEFDANVLVAIPDPNTGK